MKMMAGLFGAVLVLVLTGGILATIPSGGSAPSMAASAEIPPELLDRYVDAAATCDGLPWQVLAAIGFIESGHGAGRASPTTGNVNPPILGPALNGSDGTAEMADPSSPDGWMHAQGPMQFLPTTWVRWGRLAPGRPAGAIASPHNAWDAIYSAAAYLCAGRTMVEDLDQAIVSYNHSNEYLGAVWAKAIEYGLGQPAVGTGPGGRACPVAGPVSFTDDWGDPRSGGRTHKGNDLFAAHGTPLVAVESGVIEDTNDAEVGLGGIDLWLRGDSGDLYYYAHNALNLARPGDRVNVGHVLGRIGDTGNARGGPPHVHFQHHPAGGEPVNAYPVLAGICSGLAS